MSKPTFDEVELFLVDPDLNIRQNLVSVLQSNGFRNVKIGRTTEDLLEGLDESMPDLLICESDMPGGDISDTINKMRHHEIGNNPFLPVIVLTLNPTPDLVRKIIENGADDLVAKPVSASKLMERINLLVKARKPFVVTSDYIGPERRDKPSNRVSAPTVDVPNPLRSKVMGEADGMELQNAIEDAIDQVNIHKLERYAVQIEFIVDKIIPTLKRGEINEPVKKFLDRLLFVAEDTSRRMVDTKFEHVSELCQSLIQVTNSIIAGGDTPDEKDVLLLEQLGQAIKTGFATAEESAEAAMKISETIRD